MFEMLELFELTEVVKMFGLFITMKIIINVKKFSHEKLLNRLLYYFLAYFKPNSSNFA